VMPEINGLEQKTEFTLFALQALELLASGMGFRP